VRQPDHPFWVSVSVVAAVVVVAVVSVSVVRVFTAATGQF